MPDFSLKFDTYVFPNVAENFSTNFGNRVPATTRLTGLSGGFDADGTDPAPAEIGNVTFSFYLMADRESEMQAKIDEVLRLVTWGLKKLYYQPQGSYAPRWCWAKVNNLGLTQRSEDGLLVQRVDASFQAADPQWYENEVTQGINSSGTLTIHTVNHKGTGITKARLRFAGGPCTNPTVRRLVGGVVHDEVTYTGTLSGGDTLEINPQTLSVTKNNAGVFADFDFADPDWLRLLPGDNTLHVIFANGGDAATITIHHDPTYV